MALSSQHITGFAIGIGTAAAGIYLYKQNQAKVDSFLAKHGINLPATPPQNMEDLTLEQLIMEKERLEDIIAEREYAAENQQETEEPAPAPEEPAPAQSKTKTTRARKK